MKQGVSRQASNNLSFFITSEHWPGNTTSGKSFNFIILCYMRDNVRRHATNTAICLLFGIQCTSQTEFPLYIFIFSVSAEGESMRDAVCARY